MTSPRPSPPAPAASAPRSPALLTLALLALAALLPTPGCTGEPTPEGFVVLIEAAPQALDPRFVTDDIGTKISQLVFVGLVSFDTPDATPRLVLAESIEQRDDLRYDVTLREGVRFHDGSPLSAEDVAFTYRSMPSQMQQIERIDVHDARRLTFVLREPFAPFMMSLSMGIVSRRQVQRDAELLAVFGLEPARRGVAQVGAGPFAFEARRGDQLIVLRRFDGYVEGPAALERLVFKTVRDDNARIIALLGGSADLAINNVTPLLLPVIRDDAGLDVTTGPSIKYAYVMFNTRVPPLDRLEVRRAIALAINRQELIDHKLRGLATPASGMFSPAHWAYEPDVTRYPHDPARARALLDAAGLPDPDGDGPEMRFWLTFRTTASKLRKALAELIAAQLAEVGVGVRVEAMEFGVFYAQVNKGNFELATLQWPSPIEPDILRYVFHSEMVPYEHPRGIGRNRGGFADPELDALLERARASSDRDERRRLYRRAQQALAQQLPYVSLWHEHNIAVTRAGTTGFTLLPNARLHPLVHTRAAPE